MCLLCRSYNVWSRMEDGDNKVKSSTEVSSGAEVQHDRISDLNSQIDELKRELEAVKKKLNKAEFERDSAQRNAENLKGEVKELSKKLQEERKKTSESRRKNSDALQTYKKIRGSLFWVLSVKSNTVTALCLLSLCCHKLLNQLLP